MQLKDNVEKKYERKNRFNGEAVMLTAEEARRHDNIFINELAATMEDKAAGIDGHSDKWKAVRKRSRLVQAAQRQRLHGVT